MKGWKKIAGDVEYVNKAFIAIHKISRDIENMKKAIGRIENRQCCESKGATASENEFKVYSQFGEDGIIQWLIRNLEIRDQIFIEFGVENYEESNTRFLLENNNWSGLILDGNKESIEHIRRSPYYWMYNLKAECAFITKENINSLIKENGLEGGIGILSIDIDGNDYWIWKEIEVVNPDIVIIEYNSGFGPEAKVTVPYSPDFIRHKYNYTGLIYGASVSALNELGEKKGYSLVAGNNAGNNLFFVRRGLCNDVVKKIDVKSAYRESKYREMKGDDGKLTYASFQERRQSMCGAKVWNIDKGKMETLKDVWACGQYVR